MNAYDDGQIKTIIETHWLTLDDDDGNIDNGTPNYAHIDAGFRDQGFPGFTLPAVSFANVTQLPDTLDETGPYIVDADISRAVQPAARRADPALAHQRRLLEHARPGAGGWADLERGHPRPGLARQGRVLRLGRRLAAAIRGPSRRAPPSPASSSSWA